MSKDGEAPYSNAPETLAVAECRGKHARDHVPTVPFSKLSDIWKRDPDFVAEYECIGTDMALAFALSEARREAGLTQIELAKVMGTSQAAIARLEGGKVKPTWETVERYAKALGRRPELTLVAAE